MQAYDIRTLIKVFGMKMGVAIIDLKEEITSTGVSDRLKGSSY